MSKEEVLPLKLFVVFELCYVAATQHVLTPLSPMCVAIKSLVKRLSESTILEYVSKVASRSARCCAMVWVSIPVENIVKVFFAAPDSVLSQCGEEVQSLLLQTKWRLALMLTTDYVSQRKHEGMLTKVNKYCPSKESCDSSVRQPAIPMQDPDTHCTTASHAS